MRFVFIVLALSASMAAWAASGNLTPCEKKVLAEANQAPPPCNPIDPTCGTLKAASEAKQAALVSCLKAVRGMCPKADFDRTLASCPKEYQAQANSVHECACAPPPAAPSGAGATKLK
jgi:hypothetical protein